MSGNKDKKPTPSQKPITVQKPDRRSDGGRLSNDKPNKSRNNK